MNRILNMAAALALAACAGQAWAEQVRLTFLHVNDVYEYKPVDGQGGLAELMTRLEEERARSPNTLFTFGGDLLSPSLASIFTKGAHMVEFFNALGVAAAAPGNHEFDTGPDNFAEKVAASRFPWVGTNVLGADGKPFGGMVTSAMVEKGGVKVGFLGVCTTRTGSMSSAGGVTFTDEKTAATAAAKALRAQGAEVVVALTHLYFNDDRDFARSVKGIDLVLGGHDHDVYAALEGGALVLKAGHDAYWLAAADLIVDRPDRGKRGPTTVRPAGWRFVPVAGAAPHPKLQPLVAKYDGMLSAELKQPLGTLTTAMDSRSDTVRGGEAAIGNLIADAMRERMTTDVAIINGGGIRGKREYAAGITLTRGDMLAEMPFSNVLVVLEVTGAQLLAAMEYGLSEVEQRAGRFPQISGMTVAYDPSKPADSRVVSAAVGDKPLDLKASYRVALTDYMANGGDGYSAFAGAKTVVPASDGPMLSDTVMAYIQARGSVAPVVDGRMKAAQ